MALNVMSSPDEDLGMKEAQIIVNIISRLLQRIDPIEVRNAYLIERTFHQ